METGEAQSRIHKAANDSEPRFGENDTCLEQALYNFHNRRTPNAPKSMLNTSNITRMKVSV